MGYRIGHFEEGSPEWEEVRRGKITATRIPAILGWSPWESRFSLWHRMAGTVDAPRRQSDEMWWGTFMEDVIASWWKEKHPDRIAEWGGTWAHDEHDWAVANPDYIVTATGGAPDGVLEIKNSRAYGQWGAPGTDEVPRHYWAQVQWQMYVVGVPYAVVAVSVGGAPPVEYRVERDEGAIGFMVEDALVFLDSIEQGKAPPLDSHEETSRIVRALPSVVDEEGVTVPGWIVDGYDSAHAAEKNAKASKAYFANEVLARLGGATKGILNGDTVFRRAVKADGSTHSLKRV